MRQNCDEETSNSVKEVMIRSRHDDKQDEEGVQEGDCTDRPVRGVKEEGETAVNDIEKKSVGSVGRQGKGDPHDEAVAKMEGRESSQLVLELVGSPNWVCKFVSTYQGS